MPRASKVMLFHYMGYLGSMVLVWLVMISSLLQIQLGWAGALLKVLLVVASILFGVFGVLFVMRGHGGG
jgi:hypothetical protein